MFLKLIEAGHDYDHSIVVNVEHIVMIEEGRIKDFDGNGNEIIYCDLYLTGRTARVLTSEKAILEGIIVQRQNNIRVIEIKKAEACKEEKD